MFKLIEDPMTLFSTAITWILHTFIDKPHTLFVVLLYAVLMSVNGLEVTYDITTFNGWELLTTLPYNASAVTPFKIITDSGKCHAATPCIQVTGAEGLYDVWIQRDVLAEGWSNMMLMYDLHTMSLDIETDEHAFVAAICDGGGEIRYRTPSVSDMANFTGALDLSSQICNVLTIRIGGYMNGGWDFVWIQSVKIEYATSSPTLSPTAYPTNGPSTYPSGPPSVSPSRSPSRNPSFPSSEPSRSPTPKPTAQPSSSPSADPTTHPTANPSLNPSIHPTTQPSKYPSANPSTYPTVSPSDQPTNTPTLNPSIPPTHLPTVNPSVSPTNNPTATPSDIPSVHPTSTPSQPTTFPTRSPSYDPSRNPTMFPTKSPSFNPTAAPTSNPTLNPSGDPTKLPTRSPTKSPSSDPTVGPTSDPSRDPTTFPTSAPSDPTSHPSGNPTMFPTKAPSSNPTTFPTRAPSTPSQPPSLASIDPTVLPTRTPSNNPTLTSTVPTMTPTKTPTYATPVITACSYGTLRFCYYVDIAPVPGIVQSRLISIQDVDRTNSVSTFYDIYVTPTTHHCVDPSVTVTYESIDYDSGGISEGFGVIRPDGTTIITCSSTNACGSFASCVTNQNVGITMLPADESNLLVTLSVAYQVDDFCTGSPSYHNYVINARLTIFCSDATAPPTTDPTVLTVSPTHAPSAAPTLAPSSAPTYPTNAPTSTPTDTTEYPTVNPTADPSGDSTTSPIRSPSSVPSQLPSLTPTDNPVPAPSISAFGTEVCVHLDPNTNNNAGFEKLMISPPQSMAEHYFQFTVSLIDSQNRDGAAIVLLSEWSNYTKWQIILGHGENDYHIRQMKYDPDVSGYATYVGERIYNGDVFRTGMTASFWISWDNGIMKIGGGDIVLQDEYLSWGTVDVVEYIWLATYHSDTACYVYDENASSLAPSIPSQPPTGSTSFVPSKNPTDDPFIDPTIGPSI
eukprot:513453_1